MYSTLCAGLFFTALCLHTSAVSLPLPQFEQIGAAKLQNATIFDLSQSNTTVQGPMNNTTAGIVPDISWEQNIRKGLQALGLLGYDLSAYSVLNVLGQPAGVGQENIGFTDSSEIPCAAFRLYNTTHDIFWRTYQRGIWTVGLDGPYVDFSPDNRNAARPASVADLSSLITLDDALAKLRAQALFGPWVRFGIIFPILEPPRNTARTTEPWFAFAQTDRDKGWPAMVWAYVGASSGRVNFQAKVRGTVPASAKRHLADLDELEDVAD